MPHMIPSSATHAIASHAHPEPATSVNRSGAGIRSAWATARVRVGRLVRDAEAADS